MSNLPTCRFALLLGCLAAMWQGPSGGDGWQAGFNAWLDDDPEPFDESLTPYEGPWIEDESDDDGSGDGDDAS